MDSQKIKSLQSYLVRLHQGEDLASVRREFEKDFASVSTEDIMEAEQDLLQAGKLSENMGHLCDLHSCLLHGKMETMGEQFPEGHPLQLFLKENEAIESHLDRLSAVMNGPFLAADVLSVLEGLLGQSPLRQKRRSSSAHLESQRHAGTKPRHVECGWGDS